MASSKPCRSVRPVYTVQGTFETIKAKLQRHEPVRILAIGSSSTEGIGASAPAKAYPAQLESDLAAAWREQVTVVNAGKGGETAVQTVERLEAALRAERFDLVIWQVGTNDAINGVGEDAFRSLVARGIAAAGSTGHPLILLDQQYFPGIKDLPRYERFVQAVGAIGREHRVTVFSRYALMKEWGTASSEELQAMLSKDGFHMGDQGYECLADCMAEAIQAIVQRPGLQASAGTVAPTGR